MRANPALALFRWRFREGVRSALVWGLSLGALCALEVGIYPSVHKSLARVVADYPEGLKQAFNLHDLSSVQAFLDVEMFSMLVPLTVGFFAIRSIVRGTVAAEERGWLDVLLAAPVTRAGLLAANCAATVCALVVLLAAVAVTTEAAGAVVGATVPLDAMLAGLASAWALAVFYVAVAVAAAGLSSRVAVVTGVSAGLLVTMYVLDLVGKVAPSASAIRWSSVFRYTGGALQNGLDVAGFAGVLALSVVLAAAGAARFTRRDIGG